jgi:hypothetical protein
MPADESRERDAVAKTLGPGIGSAAHVSLNGINLR